MKIAVDIDEVLARGLATYLNYFNSNYNTNYAEEDFTPDKGFWEVLGVSEEDIDQISKHYRASNHSKDWLLVPGAVEAIKQLAQEHELIIISNREEAGHEPTRQWLKRNFGDAFSAIIFTKAEIKDSVQPTKASICVREKANVLVEDEVKEVSACCEAGVPVVLFDTRLNQDVEGEGVRRVQSWPEALVAIQEISGQN
jgi:uncharacterized HAD superfamily protein